MVNNIHSVAVSRARKGAYIVDRDGKILIIKWKADTNSWDGFDFTHESKSVGNGTYNSICLSKDEKYLLVGSWKLLSIFEAETKTVIKKFKLTTYVIAINLVNHAKKALIGEENGNLSIFDLETFKISSVAKNITKNKMLGKILVL